MFYRNIFLSLATCLAIIPQSLAASEMRYQPTHPAFGGSPFNGSTLMSEAQAQRGFKAPTPPTNTSADFARSITNSILSRVSSRIADAIYGENARESGSFDLGESKIDFQRRGATVVVTILDKTTGGSTTVEVPAGTF